jgi:hypothetical protein
MIGMQCPQKYLRGNRFFSNYVNLITVRYKDAWMSKEVIVGPVIYNINNRKNSLKNYN